MRMSARLLLIATLSAAVPAIAAEPVKARLCRDCGKPPAGIALPAHGVLFATNGLFSFGWHAITFDRDRHTIARSYVPTQVSGQPPSAPDYAEARLTDGEFAELDAAVARVWPVAQPLPGSLATDIIWDLWLIDGDGRRRERGGGIASGAAAPLTAVLDRLAQRHLPSPPP